MKEYDFSAVDFSNPEVAKSLARAYAVLLRIMIGEMTGIENTEDCKPEQLLSEEQTNAEIRYYQERMF